MMFNFQQEDDEGDDECHLSSEESDEGVGTIAQF